MPLVCGQAMPSVNLPAAAGFQQGRGPDRDQAGGGAELSCRCTLTVETAQLRRVMAVFERYLPRNELLRSRL